MKICVQDQLQSSKRPRTKHAEKKKLSDIVNIVTATAVAAEKNKKGRGMVVSFFEDHSCRSIGCRK